MEFRSTLHQRSSENDISSGRDVPSFIEPLPPTILNPFMRPRPQKGTNLLELFEEDSVEDEVPELVQVYLRLKPSNVPSNLYEVRSDQCLITSVDTATAGHGRRTQQNVSKMYKFSHIFGPDCNQKEIFEHVVKNNLRKLPDGHSFTLLTYGASGSGKTYTLMGTVKAPGLVPRSLEYVFHVVEAAQQPLYRPGESRAKRLTYAEQAHELQWVNHLRHVSAPLREKYRRMSTRLVHDITKSTLDLSNRTKHYVWVSFVEIYNEAIYDLLVTTERTAASKLRIREDPSGNVYVKGATQAFVRSGEEAYDVLVAGKHNLQVHATGVHSASSRSHCIFTITMLTETESGVRSSYVRLCDLAGSERVRKTRNTGARMQESRAINSSLHVLERCLHTLRRKQTNTADLVPYRESKLTRLLGAGLSGARGEAVSMVVTLNPAPEYAHETRHVLQLAVVARDIQVNNTIAESISTFDNSSAHETSVASVASSAEVMRLRADNERLHYELVQAQTMNKKLLCDMEEKQEEAAVTLKELVAEARDITEQYYKSQLTSMEERHRAEIAELREDYESKLSLRAPSADGTPSKSLQNKILQLLNQISILEEELNAERLARARAEAEMQHLRACIEERDDKAFDEDDNRDDTISVTDSEEGSDDIEDLPNESLEPTFKKEDINRSRLLRQSMLNNTHNNTFDNDVVFNKSDATLKDDSHVSEKDMTDVCEDSKVIDAADETYDESNNNSCNESMDCPATVKKAEAKEDFIKNNEAKDNRGTYFVMDSKIDNSKNRGTYFISSNSISSINNDSDTGINADISEESNVEKLEISKDVKLMEKPVNSQLDKIRKFALSTSSDNSLTQFELLEREANGDEEKAEGSKEPVSKYFNYNAKDDSVKKDKEKKTYFDMGSSPIKLNMDVVKNLKKQDDIRSPSIVNDDVPENYEPTTINKILRESLTKNLEIPINKLKVLQKKHDSIDMFEEMDSPACVKLQDILKSVEKVRKSVDNLILDDKIEEVNPTIEEKNCNIKENDDKEVNEKSPGDVNEKHESITETVSEKVLDISINENANSNVVELSNGAKETNVFKAPDAKTDVDLNIQTVENNDNKSPNVKKLIKQERQSSVDMENALESIANGFDKPVEETNNISLVTESKIFDVTASTAKENNTLDAFEDIYKDVTAARATDFELLVPTVQDESKIDKPKVKYNLRAKHEENEEVEAKGATKTKKSLRLRKRKNQNDDDKEDKEKLKDILNLQNEFSDVTLDVPAPVKVVNDIPSPEKCEMENVPPSLITQSCPSKSVTRSRRKLFTPRAEPLEESPSQAGDSNDKIRVPRPSYHRTRTRRRLN